MGASSEAKKYYRKMAAIAIDQGWRIEDVKDGWKFFPGDKSFPAVVVHKTPSENRWMKNKDRDFRLSGLRF